MSNPRSRALPTILLALVALPLSTEPGQAATYAVLVRWAASTGPGVAGYRVTARPRSGGTSLVVDAGQPAPAADGSRSAQVAGLDGRTDYDVTATAYTSAGLESLASNSISIGYAQVAGRIDSDGDGLMDAAEDPNLNRVLDAGETDALSADSDGDGVGDASDQCQGTAAGATVNAAGCSCAQVACSGGAHTIWPGTATPVRADRGADNAVEVGVKFRSDVAGTVTGLRFYKHVLNTGTHVGNLWSSTGARLATATFTGETASGWQQVNFATPVAISANATYVASYFAPNAHYSFDVNYFATQGVDRVPLHAPASAATGGNGVYAYGPTSAFPNQSYSATNYWVDVVFTTGTPPPPTLAITTTALPSGTVGGAYVATLAASGGTPPYTWSIASGALPQGLALNASTGTISGTPTTAGLSSFSVQVRAGTESATSATSIRIDAPAQGETIWPSTAVPVVADGGPDSAAELGVKFRSDVAGWVTGIRFYKHAFNTGMHVGNLWSSGGTRLATATFSGESASGWQRVNFATPVAISANTVYVASYLCPQGHYADDRNYFSGRGVDNPPLHALATGVAGPNSVYAYGTTSRFPTQTYAATNYWVDLVFSATLPAGGTAGAPAGSTALGVAERASRGVTGADAFVDASEGDATCSDQPDARRGRLRRFLLKRRNGGYRLTAIGRFTIPDGTDLAASGMALRLLDGAGRVLVAATLSGADLDPTASGWRSRPRVNGIERLRVRRRGTGATVSLRTGLPAFSADPDPALVWQVAFGAGCAERRALSCTDATGGNRRCRPSSTTAAVGRQAPRER